MSNVSATWTPSLATTGTDGSVEQIRQLVPCGGTMYAVGRFSEIKQGQATQTRNNAFSFNASTGVLTNWNPNVNGQVNSVALSTDCSVAYLGGTFTTIGSTPAAVKNIAAVSTGTGAVIPGFASSAGAKVNTLAMVKGGTHLLVGGNFTSINGSTKKYLVSLNPTTGKDDGYVNLNISGKYVYTDDGGQQSRGTRRRSSTPRSAQTAPSCWRWVYSRPSAARPAARSSCWTSARAAPRSMPGTPGTSTSIATSWSPSTFRQQPGHLT
ncbi:MAG: hypothetical protein WKF82_03255 [Nocardioidaceae bacterium]